MQPSAHEAWKYNEEIRQYFEASFDMNVEPPKHVGFVCKCCWETFDAGESPIGLAGHALGHSQRSDIPYSRKRPSPITGEQVCDFHSQLMERFNMVLPEAGTWKFECKICMKRLPHRSSFIALLAHSEVCREELEAKSGRVN